MKQFIEQLRELTQKAETAKELWEQQAIAMQFMGYVPQLLDRLEVLENVAEAADDFINSDGDYFSWTEDERHCMSKLKNTLMVLKGYK